MKTQGLKRRIATEEEMRYTAERLVAERNGRCAKIEWRFTKTKAREKFPTLYTVN